MSASHTTTSSQSPERVPVLKVGIVGFGYASATFHAPLVAATPGLRLAAVVSSAPDKVRRAWPDVEVLDSPAALCARADIDLVVIATPNITHFPLARQALQAGKHVVVDKPFVLDTAEARQLIALAEENALKLSVFHNRRWDGDFMTLTQLVADGSLGRLTHVESHFDRYRPQVRDRWRESAEPGAGLWYDLGPHLLDQSLQLFGKPATIWLDLARQRSGAVSDDWFHAVLGYERMRVILHASAMTARPAPRFTVHGTTGSWVKHGLDQQETALCAGKLPAPGQADDPQPGALLLATEQGLVERPLPTLPGDYAQYYAGMRDAILSDGPPPVTAQSACDVVALIELGVDSARRGERLVLPGS